MASYLSYALHQYVFWDSASWMPCSYRMGTGMLRMSDIYDCLLIPWQQFYCMADRKLSDDCQHGSLEDSRVRKSDTCLISNSHLNHWSGFLSGLSSLSDVANPMRYFSGSWIPQEVLLGLAGVGTGSCHAWQEEFGVEYWIRHRDMISQFLF